MLYSCKDTLPRLFNIIKVPLLLLTTRRSVTEQISDFCLGWPVLCLSHNIHWSVSFSLNVRISKCLQAESRSLFLKKITKNFGNVEKHSYCS